MSDPSQPAIYLPPSPVAEAPPEQAPRQDLDAGRAGGAPQRGEEWDAYSLDILTAFFDS
jgi:hypothetical protein